ncbi:MAG: hypothetical protein CM15mP18_0600 [Methanobacteriota archaeon]|nr:MAG: hypothetical protein CM15mP18_0600 [Euryarchaeota archaeon]
MRAWVEAAYPSPPTPNAGPPLASGVIGIPPIPKDGCVNPSVLYLGMHATKQLPLHVGANLVWTVPRASRRRAGFQARSAARR